MRLRKVTRCLLVLVAGGASLATSAVAANWEVNGSLWLGARELDEETWRRVDDQLILGASVDFRRDAWPVSVAVTWTESENQTDCGRRSGLFSCDDWNREGRVRDLSLGVRKIWQPGMKTNLFLGGGYSLVSAKLQNRVSSQPDGSDRTSGVSLEAGIYWRGETGFIFGFSSRALLGADIRFSGDEFDADYVDFNVLVGWGNRKVPPAP